MSSLWFCVGLGVASCVLLCALAAEVYCLLWRKRRVSNHEEERSKHRFWFGKDLIALICWKGPASVHGVDDASGPVEPKEEDEGDMELGKELNVKMVDGEDNVEAELMRIHNLAGPRLLFTIMEETKEELESEDFMVAIDTTPSQTPLVSPNFKSPISSNSDSPNPYGFQNPLFSPTEAELNRIRSSPPPTFKFLRDAEEKLQKKLALEGIKGTKVTKHDDSGQDKSFNPTDTVKDPTRGSFLTFMTGIRNKEQDEVVLDQPNQQTSSSAQILPLDCSPTSWRQDPHESHNYKTCSNVV